MILYKGIMPNHKFNLDGFFHISEVTENDFDHCISLLTNIGSSSCPVEHYTTLCTKLRLLTNTVTKEIKAFIFNSSIKLQAENYEKYSYDRHFLLPTSIFNADNVKSKLRQHLLAWMFNFQDAIIDDLRSKHGTWFDHNQKLYDQMINDETITPQNPKFYPESLDSCLDVFNHTYMGLSCLVKEILENIIQFAKEYDFSCIDQLEELRNEISLPL